MNVATGIWPREDTPCCGYQVVQEPDGVHFLIDNAIDQRIEQLTPHPRPLSPSQLGARGDKGGFLHTRETRQLASVPSLVGGLAE